MKASELIQILQQKIELDGDLEVLLPAEAISYRDEFKGKSAFPVVGVNTWCDPNTDKPIEFMVMDEGWADALI